MTPLLPNPFAYDQQAYLDLKALEAIAGAVDDELAKLPASHRLKAQPAEAIDPPPAFLANPSKAYLSATQLMPIAEIITRHASH